MGIKGMSHHEDKQRRQTKSGGGQRRGLEVILTNVKLFLLSVLFTDKQKLKALRLPKNNTFHFVELACFCTIPSLSQRGVRGSGEFGLQWHNGAIVVFYFLLLWWLVLGEMEMYYNTNLATSPQRSFFTIISRISTAHLPPGHIAYCPFPNIVVDVGYVACSECLHSAETVVASNILTTTICFSFHVIIIIISKHQICSVCGESC